MNYIQLEEVLNEIPVAYYFGSPLTVKINDTASTSYIDFSNMNINISASQINSFINNDEADMELIRSIVYHELSHALLTPKQAAGEVSWLGLKFDIFNIFEDERIETLLKDYYLKINFKKLVFEINKTTPEAVNKKTFSDFKTPEEAFYNIVRLDFKYKQYNDEVYEIIDNAKKINFNSLNSYFYISQVRDLYNKIEAEFLLQNQDQEQDQNQDQEQDQNQDQEQEKPASGLEAIEDEEVKKAISNALDKIKTNITIYNPQTTAEEFKRVISKYKTESNKAGGIKTGYSGRLDARLFAKKQNQNINPYDSFKRAGDGGKKQSKIFIEFFQDCSGSYHRNEAVTNGIYKALRLFQKDNAAKFDFVVISSFDGQLTVGDVIDVRSGGGDEVPEKLPEKMQRLKSRNKLNATDADIYLKIALFDGDVCCSWSNSGCGFEYFNDRKAYIITDSDNRSYIEKYAPQCTAEYVDDDYPKHLKNTIIKLLERALKC